MNDVKRDSPSFHRNIEPITNKLHEVISKKNKSVLEIGSGSGQHVERFAREFPKLTFQPTEYDPENLASIDSWCERHSNVLSAIQLDVMRDDWFENKTQKFDALLCFNVIHISPWEVTEAIFKNANQWMNDPCQIIFYGPFKINGEHTSDSNAEFDTWLKEKDTSYGIRDIADVQSVANANGFKLDKNLAMPANNFLNIFTRT